MHGVSKMKPVGLLGGMVPQTTVVVMQRLLSITSSQRPADHIPLILHHQPQLPPQVSLQEGESNQEPMPALMGMAQDLERAGAQALAMPNVEAHHFSLAVSHATTLPFLDMVELSVARVQSKGAGSVGLLASPACRVHDVFDAALSEACLTTLWPKDEKAMSAMIADANTNAPPSDLGQRLAIQAQELLDLGADHVLLANTELSAYAADLPDAIPFTDSLQCLCEGIVAFASA